EVLDVLSGAALSGKLAVRLHSGDASLYGAIREQIDALVARGIACEVVPGVSSFSAAAAALMAEYTLPAISQTLIISRAAGRTPVPDRESLANLAKHRSSMVLFLSSGMIDRAASELIRGGYPPDTAAAVVQRASWPDQRVARGSLSTIAGEAARLGIDRTALILVGDFLGEGGYERSKLYDPEFSHGYRNAGVAGRDGTVIVSLTAAGLETALRVRDAIGGRVYAPERHIGESGAEPLSCPIGEWAAGHFHSARAMIFVSACGIAVRAIAPLLRGKAVDPAVVCLDDEGRNVVSLLSGHIGGANGLAERIAEITGGSAVVTTATDVRGIASADGWASEMGHVVENPGAIRDISAAMLDGREVGVAITPDLVPPPWPVTLWLRPRNLVLGIGSVRGITAEAVESAVGDFLDGAGVSPLSLKAVATIDIKKDERAIAEWALHRGLSLMTYGAAELAAVKGAFASSERVLRETGVDNVCERSAVLAAGKMSDAGADGVLMRSKTVYPGLTLALARIRGCSG
ncbi:MAG: cobalamin biosynthesis protein, partial [Synergistaceae bacterium]|nr:cobalamin biosynthesis protein [Synergistaceae bacterium]